MGSTPPKHKSEKDIPTKTQVGRKHSQALREDILKYSRSHRHLRPLVPHLCLLAPIVIKTFFLPQTLDWVNNVGGIVEISVFAQVEQLCVSPAHIRELMLMELWIGLVT